MVWMHNYTKVKCGVAIVVVLFTFNVDRNRCDRTNHVHGLCIEIKFYTFYKFTVCFDRNHNGATCARRYYCILHANYYYCTGL